MNQADEARLRAHVHAIDDCNQRGGRMLSLVDLIAARTVNLELAAYLAAMMRGGTSLLVGARPGGAGKTAVMCALLNFLPDHVIIRPVASRAVLVAARESEPAGQACYLAHEIGAGPYYAYAWGERARAFLHLQQQGHIVASNLHADTLEETYDQLCGDVGARQEDVRQVELKIYLGVRHTSAWSMQRWVSRVYESEGSADRLLWVGDAEGIFARQGDSAITSRITEDRYADFLQGLADSASRRIEAVRRALIEGRASSQRLSR